MSGIQYAVAGARIEEIEMEFLKWTSLNRPIELCKSKILGSLIGFFVCALALIFAIIALAAISQLLIKVLNFDNDDGKAIRNVGLVVVAFFGAPLLVWRSVVAQKQADTAEQNHITDQINKAVEGLGSEKAVNKIGRPVTIFTGTRNQRMTFFEDGDEDIKNFVVPERSVETGRMRDHFYDNRRDDVDEGVTIEYCTWDRKKTEIEWQGSDLVVQDDEHIAEVGNWSVFSESAPNIEVRVGSVYALERIAKDSLRDHIQIMEILTAYIRENSPAISLQPSVDFEKPARPRSDIQAALDVIKRRAEKSVEHELTNRYRLDLRNTDLSGADFTRGNFVGVLFMDSRLEGADFRWANLKAARLQRCLLNFTNLYEIDLTGAVLDEAVLNQTYSMMSSFSVTKSIRGLSMAGGDFSAVDYISTEEKHTPTFATADTKFSDHTNDMRVQAKAAIRDFSISTISHKFSCSDDDQNMLKEAGFLYWADISSQSMDIALRRKKLYQHLGFFGFPFDD